VFNFWGVTAGYRRRALRAARQLATIPNAGLCGAKG